MLKVSSTTCHSSLAELTSSTSEFRAGGLQYRLLARHETRAPSGDFISDFVFQRMSPKVSIGPQDVKLLKGWKGVVVVASCPMDKGLLDAFFYAGVKGVIMPSESKFSVVDSKDMVSFFQALYGSLFGGDDMLSALRLAESKYTMFSGMFRVHLRPESVVSSGIL